MTKPVEDSKQAIPSPEDRVRAIREREQKATKGPWIKISTSTERDPGCGISSQIGDGTSYRVANIDIDDLELDEQNKNAEFVAHARADIPYLLSLVEELKGQVVSDSPQPKCPRCPDSTLTIGQGDGRFWVTCGRGHAAEVPLDFQIADFAQFFAAAPAAEARKRKDYHAEYVEAVEAAEKAQGDLGVMREALRRLRNNAMQGKVTSALIDEVDVFLFPALTPEPASQAAKEKKP